MLNPHLKPVLEFLPLAIFLLVFKTVDLFYATAALIVATLVILAITFMAEKRIALVPLFTALAVTVFGGLSIWFKNDIFIKMKPTVIYGIFSLTLLIGCLRGKGLLRHITGAAFELTERGWWLLSLRFGLFFLGMALLNELVWRTMSTDWWVNFKVFGGMGLMMVFTVLQAGFIQRFQKNAE